MTAASGIWPPRCVGRRVAVASAVVLLVSGTPIDTPSDAQATSPAAAQASWHDGPCAPDDNVGVTVVVDFQELGGGVNIRCTGEPASDGADALDRAGISWQGVVRWGRGFVCKIAGKPANDPCIDTPPASAYWSYWIAPRGGNWCYSNRGVLNRTPPPGSVEGWSFSLDRQDGTSPTPRYAPPPLAAGLRPNPLASGECDPGGGTVGTPLPNQTTTTTSPRPTGDGSGGGGPTGGGGTVAPDAPVGSGTRPGARPADPSAPAPQDASSTTTPADDVTTTSADEGEGSVPDPGPEAEGDADGASALGGSERAAGASGASNGAVDLSVDGSEQDGLPASTIAGLALVTIVAAGALLAARRRRLGTDLSLGDDVDESS